MEIEEAGKEELDTYVELWFSLAKGMEKYSNLNSLVYDSVGEVSEEGFKEQLESEEYTYYLIKEDGAIGFITLEEGKHPSRKYSKYTRIVNLFIREEYRNQGLGAQA
ncbi:MAG: GNAT family N-acetyltransferase, partial [Candidatus Nanohaloarchaea archaeon]